MVYKDLCQGLVPYLPETMTHINGGAATMSEGGSSGSSGGRGGSSNGADGALALKKGPWTAAEDQILMEYVRKHGEGNWNSVQRNSGLNRCGKSCRLRWANHLRPNLKKGAFTPEEERLILELHAKYGNKWARMAAQVRHYDINVHFSLNLNHVFGCSTLVLVASFFLGLSVLLEILISFCDCVSVLYFTYICISYLDEQTTKSKTIGTPE